ncbi:type 3 dihydrofolate reductase [soil metagenome]
MPSVKLIAAVDDKLGIAKHNKIPWDLPSDKKYFRAKLEPGPVASGWKTYAANGRKPYGHGNNTVFTRNYITIPGVTVLHDAESFFENLHEDTWVSGGGQIFDLAIQYATHLYLTRVSGDFGCNTFFPEFENEFVLISDGTPLVENGISFRYQVWERKRFSGVIKQGRLES